MTEPVPAAVDCEQLRAAIQEEYALVARDAGAPQHSSAAKFGTLGITFRAQRLRAGEAVQAPACDLPASLR
jgi:hypothetical protein